jgi:arylsulfatase A-like enzyme
MKKIFLSVAAFAAVQAIAQNHTAKPNIVLIVADDLGFGDVSAYGQKTINTPNIDRLARGGVSFTDGHATSATSTPSRYGLFTGLYPWRNEDAKILPGDAPLLIPEDMPTMPRMFQQAGYTTAAIGKWHLGMGRGKIDWNKQITPSANAVGFDYTNVIAATVDRVPTVYVKNGLVEGLDPNDPIYVDYERNFEGEPTALTNPELVKMKWSHGHQNTIVNGIPRIGFMKGGKKARWDDTTMAQYLVDEVKRFISANSQRPFFLYYGLHEPHVPRVPMAQFAGSTALGPRGDVVVEADWCVGEVIKALEANNQLENTIIIFTSDNGPVLDDGYEDGARGTRNMHDPNGGLRGGKYSLFDAGTRVPFFVYWKGHIQPVENNSLMTQLDLFASFADMLGADVPKDLDSQNMLPEFLGKSLKGRKDMIVEASGRLAYRYGSYALIPPYSGNATNETGNELGVVDHYALYDLAAEPSQRHDLSAEKPRLVKKLKRRFLAEAGKFYNEKTQQETLK